MLDTTFIQTLHKKNEVFRKKKEYILTKLKKNIIDLERQPGEILKLSKESINHCIYERVNKAQKSLDLSANKKLREIYEFGIYA